jgi:CheY-like chemotaxis protein
METSVEASAKLISALASLAWPLVFAVLLFKLYAPIRALVDSARARKFSIKVAGNELTMEEASEQQRVILADMQTKFSELEKRLQAAPDYSTVQLQGASTISKRILWVDDNPKNNSFLVALLEERGAKVEVAISTDEAMTKLRKQRFDIILTDMRRPEGEKAGINLVRRAKAIDASLPVYIFCGAWAAKNMREEALAAGASGITSSGTTLLSFLPLGNEA